MCMTACTSLVVQCPPLAVPDADPMSVTGVSPTSSSIALTWKPPLERCQNGEITGYQILYTNQPSLPLDSWLNQTESGTTTASTLQELEIFSDYSICIAARTVVEGYGPCSQPLTVIRTLNDSRFFVCAVIHVLVFNPLILTIPPLLFPLPSSLLHSFIPSPFLLSPSFLPSPFLSL